MLFVPFYYIYWFYKNGQKLDSMMRARNMQGDMATLCLILGIFFPFVACILMQDKFNQLCTTEAVAAQPAPNTDPVFNKEADAADAIAKYKELLDSGAITQEEFDAKKKQILGI